MRNKYNKNYINNKTKREQYLKLTTVVRGNLLHIYKIYLKNVQAPPAHIN